MHSVQDSIKRYMSQGMSFEEAWSKLRSDLMGQLPEAMKPRIKEIVEQEIQMGVK